ncbi:MAG: hypothetical protein ACD_73C00119G0002 [uncultured bacterium]|nr:MAG: hypothetical protein ACD_73C00119G0002 [uncultured bacterium]
MIPYILSILFIFSFLSPAVSFAKKKDKAASNSPKVASTDQTPLQKRLASMTGEDQRLFDSLSSEQKDKITKGQIDIDFNAWMVKLALGEPLYGTEHHPIYTDYEEVWLYAKPEISRDVKEDKIIDPQTNWPTIHRYTTIKKCNVSDFFVLWDRGVVVAIKPSPDRNINGTCTIEHTEEFLPIVNGKPVEPK